MCILRRFFCVMVNEVCIENNTTCLLVAAILSTIKLIAKERDQVNNKQNV